MNMLKYKVSKNQSGQTVLLTLIVLSGVLLTVILLLSGSLTYFTDSSHALASLQALNLAEAGIDKAVASINATAGTYNGESDTPLDNGTFTVTVTTKDASTSIIKSTGYIPNKTKPKAQKTVTIQITKGSGISFVYGMLVGNGGITMGNGSAINGSIYSNGNIVGGNNETITGDVFVAGGTQPSADQQSDCTSPNCLDYIFGKNVSGESRQDVAQSFKSTTTAVINKVSLKLKKTGSPSNPTVRIVADNAGKPDKNNVLTSGTLNASLVTSQYGYVDVTFSTTPSLNANTSYWIMVHSSTLDNSNYWSWSEDSLSGYARGSAAFSPDWQAKNPVWNVITGDLGFQSWMGGVPTSVSMSNGSVIQGNTHANTINGLVINKDAYYQTIANTTVKGTSYPNSSDPAPVPMPISQSNITDWQNQAASAGINNGDLSGCPVKLNSGKYVGNFITGSNCTITVVPPIWLTGNLIVGNSVIFKMDSSLGSYSGVMIIDGTTTFGNGDDLKGTGSQGSYLTLLSTYNSQSNGTIAINTGNSSITGILYAPFGILSLANNANFKEAVAWQIITGNNTILSYDSGLISTFFSAGPSGSFSVIKGTYQSK